MSLLSIKFFSSVANGVAQSAAAKMGSAPTKGGKKGEQCTPCAAMAKVDTHRSKLGYKTK